MPDTVMTVDVPLLRKQLDWATEQADLAFRGEFSEWDQTAWAERYGCHTVCCLAGHTVVDAGRDLLWYETKFSERAAATTLGEPIQDVAAALLGLDEGEAERLFSARNTLRDLWTIAAEITDGEITVPADLPPSPLVAPRPVE